MSSEDESLKTLVRAIVMEVALTALQDKGMREKIGDKLDLSDQELEKIKVLLDVYLNEVIPNKDTDVVTWSNIDK